LVSYLEEAFPSYNIIFKQRLLVEPWSADGFRRGISADKPFGVHEYNNVIRKSGKRK
jgi:hypothetical protein